MAVLTPGLAFLLKISPYLLLPPTIALVIEHAVTRLPGMLISDWLRILCYVLSYPIFLGIRGLLDSIREEYEIQSFGAVRVPEVKGKWPWNMDLLLSRLGRKQEGIRVRHL